MAIIKGITIILYEPTQVGTDGFGQPIYSESPVQVDNVLVTPASSQEILDSINLYGRKAVYTMAIPKGDTHTWENKHVSFFGKDFKVFGIPLEGIECDIPLDWNKKVTVEVNE